MNRIRRLCRSRLNATVLAVSLACALSGCVTEVNPVAPTSERSEIRAPAKPSGIQPQQMVLTASMMLDEDGNGFPDTVPVTIYMFTDRREYELPITHPGSFEFIIRLPDGEVLGRWVFDEQETADSIARSATGVHYRFGLRLAPEKDRMRGTTAGLRAIFTNAETGQRIMSTGEATIRLGVG